MENSRISLLDSFRAIAILLVMLFHYFSRWFSLYPYGDKYNFFSYGNMGVHFFFIISGFVILYTLEFTSSLAVFWKKRMVRLFPSMLIASIITYVVLSFFDKALLFPTSHFFKNIIASVTFIQPDLLSSLTGHIIEFDYISGSYWSLWVEIQFYLFVSFIYFLCKKSFIFVFFGATFILIASQFLLSHVYIDNSVIKAIKAIYNIFNFVVALPFFCCGIIFYIFYKNKMSNTKTEIYIKIYFIFLVIFQVYSYRSQPLKSLLVVFFLLMFFALIYFPKILSFINNKVLVQIGISSYFLYLIHENIGVLIINRWGTTFAGIEFILPILIILFLAIISIFYTFRIEKKINNFLKKRIK